MSRSLLLLLSGAIGLAALIGSASPPPDGQSSNGLSQLQLAAQNQPTANDLTAMSLTSLEQILEREVGDLQGSSGQWRTTINGRSVIVLADAANNRMRIVAPVVEASSLSEEQVQAMLVANFHSALDARYAMSNGTVVSVFIHPLSTLQENDLLSGLGQVVTLAETFGSTYSSGSLGVLPNSQRREAPRVPNGSIDL